MDCGVTYWTQPNYFERFGVIRMMAMRLTSNPAFRAGIWSQKFPSSNSYSQFHSGSLLWGMIALIVSFSLAWIVLIPIPFVGPPMLAVFTRPFSAEFQHSFWILPSPFSILLVAFFLVCCAVSANFFGIFTSPCTEIFGFLCLFLVYLCFEGNQSSFNQ